MDLTHASFFSGVGGLDLGLERAGWRTVSFSEIDPYASAVLAQHWPGVPNLGDITAIGSLDGEGVDGSARVGSRDASRATLWSGGFPCQDLSVAGKRAGFGDVGLRPDDLARSSPEQSDQPATQGGDGQDGGRGMGASGDAGTSDRYADLTRSGLAFAFLDLVERHRPPAILLENVPGLLSSNGGRDFGALLGRLEELGYGWAYRILDAQFFGVPQRRRRVFILAFHAESGLGADGAAEILSVGSRCDGHSATGDEAGEGTAAESIVRAFSPVRGRPDDNDAQANHLVSPSPDPRGVRETDGLAGRLDDRVELVEGGEQSYHQRDRIYSDLAPSLDAHSHSSGDPPIVAYRKSARVSDPGSPETWVSDGLANTLNSFDVGNVRTTHAVVSTASQVAAAGVVDEPRLDDDVLLPLGLDSHRYRCCGNGVVSNVSEWIGVRLAEAMA